MGLYGYEIGGGKVGVVSVHYRSVGECDAMFGYDAVLGVNMSK